MPVTVRVLVCVTGPLEVASRSPVTVVGAAPKVRPAEFVVRLPLVPSTVRPPTAVSTVTPVVRLAVRSFLSLMVVAPPVRVSAPTKSLPGSDKVTLLLPALMFDVPVTVRVLLCVTGPLEVASRSPVTVVGAAPKVRPAEFVVRLPLVPSTVRPPTAVRAVTPVVESDTFSALASLSDTLRQFPLLALSKVTSPPKSLFASVSKAS